MNYLYLFAKQNQPEENPGIRFTKWRWKGYFVDKFAKRTYRTDIPLYASNSIAEVSVSENWHWFFKSYSERRCKWHTSLFPQNENPQVPGTAFLDQLKSSLEEYMDKTFDYFNSWVISKQYILCVLLFYLSANIYQWRQNTVLQNIHSLENLIKQGFF